METYYTVDEIAKLTKLSTRTIRRYISDGTLQGKKAGKQWRFTQQDLENFFDASELRAELDSHHKKEVMSFYSGEKITSNTKNITHSILLISANTTNQMKQLKEAILVSYNNQHYLESTLSLNVLGKTDLQVILTGPLVFLTEFSHIILSLLQKEELP